MKLKTILITALIPILVIGMFSSSVPYFSHAQNATTNGTSDENANDAKTLRIGYFPNVNHAQAVIGLNNGDFQKHLNFIKLESQVFNSGASAIDALFSGKIDIAYVGPNPAINGYLASGGDLKIISGSANGGSVFVVRNDSG